MTTWNYRVIKVDTHPDDVIFSIHEVYYDSKGEIGSCTESAVGIISESSEGLLKQIEEMKKAFSYPVLSLAELLNNEGGKPYE